MRKIDSIHIHHSGTEMGNAVAFDTYHRVHNGWSGVGYHFVILNGKVNREVIPLLDGQIEVGRPLSKTPASVKNHNMGAIAICLIGDEVFTAPQIRSLYKLLNDLMRRYNIPYTNIVGHREIADKPTSCPGFDVSNIRASFENGNYKEFL